MSSLLDSFIFIYAIQCNSVIAGNQCISIISNIQLLNDCNAAIYLPSKGDSKTFAPGDAFGVN